MPPKLATTDAKLITDSLGLVQRKLAAVHAKLVTRSPGLAKHALRAPTELKPEHTELPLECAQAVAHPTNPAALSGRTDESDGEIQVHRTWGPYHDSPMAFEVHQRHGDMSPKASTRSNVRDQVREGRINKPTPRGETAAARGLPAEPRAPGNEATWTIVKMNFPEQDRTSVQEAAGGS